LTGAVGGGSGGRSPSKVRVVVVETLQKQLLTVKTLGNHLVNVESLGTHLLVVETATEVTDC
jgi:hypothetical protein